MNRGKRYQKKKKRRGGKFHRGFFLLEQMKNPNKYIQPQDLTMNSKPAPEYRSSWEKKFMEWCDVSDKVETWGVEPFPIMYLSPKDNKMHRYYIDVVMKMSSGQKILVEIKPKNQCNNPINLAKWEAAREYCKQIGAVFTVVTEVELKRWKLIK